MSNLFVFFPLIYTNHLTFGSQPTCWWWPGGQAARRVADVRRAPAYMLLALHVPVSWVCATHTRFLRLSLSLSHSHTHTPRVQNSSRWAHTHTHIHTYTHTHTHTHSGMFALSVKHTLICFHWITRAHRHAVVYHDVKYLSRLTHGVEAQPVRSLGGWYHSKVNDGT